jgi:hypothetical protein
VTTPWASTYAGALARHRALAHDGRLSEGPYRPWMWEIDPALPPWIDYLGTRATHQLAFAIIQRAQAVEGEEARHAVDDDDALETLMSVEAFLADEARQR